MTEEAHDKGKIYVDQVKKILFDTRNFSHLTTAYDHPYFQTIKIDLIGDKKTFDLKATCLIDNLDVYIEAKNYEKSNDLTTEYKKFLKDCFSIWVKEKKKIKKWKSWFFFIAKHPFYCSKSFKELKSINFLKKILNDLKKSDKSKNSLIAYLKANIPDIIENFLNYIEIFFITSNYSFLSTNFERYVNELNVIFRGMGS